MNIPSKQELKEQYHISDDDFDILTELPPDKVVREKGFLMKIGEALGVQTWMWKSWLGIVLAVIFIPPQLKDAYDYWTPKAAFAYQQLYTYVQTRDSTPPDDGGWIAFTPDGTLPPSGTNAPVPLTGFPVGTGIFPASGHNPFV